MDRWTRLGIEAYRTGNREQAQRFFHYALMERPNDIRTWLWLLEVADNDTEKLRCLNRVLALDPNHILARRVKEEIDANLAIQKKPSARPFGQAQDPTGRPSDQNSAVEIRSTPPFNEELAQQHSRATTASLRTGETAKAANRKRIWILIGIVLGGLVGIILLLMWSLHLFYGLFSDDGDVYEMSAIKIPVVW